LTSKKDIIQEYLSGASLGYLAKFYGVSRQRIHQVVKKEGVHREPIHTAKRQEAYAFFDAQTDLVIHLRGQRAQWDDIYFVITDDKTDAPSEIWFARWRVDNKINLVINGHGPEVYCSKCFDLKPRSEFHHHKNGPDGIASVCKSCVREYQTTHMAEFTRRNAEYRARRKANV
jgi:hypothetical protein